MVFIFCSFTGTSIDAIRSVVNYSKICVLNLHPQSLKILRSSDLKPFVVFVAPPSLEKLRQKRLKNGEPYKVCATLWYLGSFVFNVICIIQIIIINPKMFLFHRRKN